MLIQDALGRAGLSRFLRPVDTAASTRTEEPLPLLAADGRVHAYQALARSVFTSTFSLPYE